MAVPVNCKCGKKFKVKDQLAGKAVRCPGCGAALRIPGPASTAGKGAAPPAPEKSNAELALERYEEAQKKKQMTAEEEATYREEQNKLIASYDQLSGRGGKPGEKKKKGEFAEVGVKKRTLSMKIADFIGILKGNLLFKYIFIVVVLGGGAVGSVYLVKFVTGYMHHEARPSRSPEERIRDFFAEAEVAAEQKDKDRLERCLNEILKIDRNKEFHRDFRALKEKLSKL